MFRGPPTPGTATRRGRPRPPEPVVPADRAVPARHVRPGPQGLCLGLLLLAAAALCPPPAGGQDTSPSKIIRAIEIRGLVRMPESELLSRLGRKIRIGEVYDPAAVSEETGRLYSLGSFRQVEPRVEDFEDGVKLIFLVEEKPTVRRVRLVGRSELTRSHIVSDEPGMLTREGALFNEYWVRRDQAMIRDKYLEAGYLFADVRAEEEVRRGGVDVTFRIFEGTRVRIREVSFVGNRAISSGELLDLMSTREKDFWFFGLVRPGFYDPEDLQKDLLTIKQYYRRFGYFDVLAEPRSIRFDDAKERLLVEIRIEEGPVYEFKGYRFSGNAVFTEQTLRKLTSAQPGKPFNMDQMEKDRQEILKYYGDRAYIFAKVEPQFENDYDSDAVWVHLEIDEDNEIYIEHVHVQGNLKTQDRVIRRELEFYPNEKVDREKMEKSRSNLARLQLFRDISYDFEEAEGGDPSSRDIVVRVDEESSGQLIVGFGVTSGFGIIGNLSITKRNFDIADLPDSLYDIPDSFTGAGQTLHITAQPGTQRSLYRLTFVEPYIFDTRNSLSLSASKLDLIREDWDEDRAAFHPRLGHAFDFDRDFRVWLGSRLEEVEVKEIEPTAPPDVVASAGHSTVISLNTDLGYNKVLYEPYEGAYDGHSQGIFYEYAGGPLGGQVDFHKVELSNDFYFPLYVHKEGNLHHVISLRNRFGVIDPHGDDDFIPIFERYFLGGPRDVRGFRFRGLGPHVNDTPTGGTTKWWGNVEYTFPIFQKILRGVIFFDYGNLQLSDSFAELDLSRMRYAAGGGLKINFPWLGQPLPIALYFGVPISKEDGDRERLFLFTIGTPF